MLVALAACTKPTHTYYVDATHGNDDFSGTSPRQPLRSLRAAGRIHLNPGDSLLFRRGETFSGQLELNACGTSRAPVVIGAYGSGEKLPLIAGYDTSAYAVHIFNSRYLTLQNLEITNRGSRCKPGRTGLLVECRNFGVSEKITIRRLTVRDVNGSLVKEEGGGSGILLVNAGDSIRSRFDSLTIEHCHILRCERNAMIWNGYSDRRNWYPSKHTVVRYNLIEQVPGDGIVPIGCDSTLIEHNVMCDSPDTLPPTEAAAGIWPWSCDHTLIQFNEVSGHKAPWDAQGFDSDYNCRHTVIRYNYSHDNYGGMVLICNNGAAGAYSCGNVGTVVQYNLSIGDGIRPKPTRQGMFSPGIHLAGPVRNTLVERNIIHMRTKADSRIDRTMLVADNWDGYADSTCFRQNVFYSPQPSTFRLTRSTRNDFDRNVYAGTFTHIPEHRAGSRRAEYYIRTMASYSAGNEPETLLDTLTLYGRKCRYVNDKAIRDFFQRLYRVED